MNADLIHITRLTHRSIEELLPTDLTGAVSLVEAKRTALGEIGGVPIMRVDYEYVLEKRKSLGRGGLIVRTRDILEID